ncbi:MAG: hypothetical protein BGO67_05780 [Alphaproteobacteria bacterium 41-28]|nr:MAG: hypothetical protein BGO67_05780 [Alphaproteobacteria bacterium 41-28]
MDLHSIIALIAYILVIIGALNWGMVGVFNVDVIARLFGPGSSVAKVFYILIGVAGIVMLVLR